MPTSEPGTPGESLLNGDQSEPAEPDSGLVEGAGDDDRSGKSPTPSRTRSDSCEAEEANHHRAWPYYVASILAGLFFLGVAVEVFGEDVVFGEDNASDRAATRPDSSERIEQLLSEMADGVPEAPSDHHWNRIRRSGYIDRALIDPEGSFIGNASACVPTEVLVDGLTERISTPAELSNALQRASRSVGLQTELHDPPPGAVTSLSISAPPEDSEFLSLARFGGSGDFGAAPNITQLWWIYEVDGRPFTVLTEWHVDGFDEIPSLSSVATTGIRWGIIVADELEVPRKEWERFGQAAES